MLMKRSHIKGIYIYVIHAYSCNSRRTCRLTETNDYTWSLFSGFHSTSSPLIVTQNSGLLSEFYSFISSLYFSFEKESSRMYISFPLLIFYCQKYISKISRFNIIFVLFEKLNREFFIYPFSFFFCHIFELLRNFIQGRY